mmetsp:Transcript_7217/g.10990  ORF Transcript_7217/g.10990 Transcript_7217/m.10990 type:complete len:204 (+) Transcript_7217:624-1235(+)
MHPKWGMSMCGAAVIAVNWEMSTKMPRHLVRVVCRIFRTKESPKLPLEEFITYFLPWMVVSIRVVATTKDNWDERRKRIMTKSFPIPSRIVFHRNTNYTKVMPIKSLETTKMKVSLMSKQVIRTPCFYRLRGDCISLVVTSLRRGRIFVTRVHQMTTRLTPHEVKMTMAIHVWLTKVSKAVTSILHMSTLCQVGSMKSHVGMS